jgi:transcriptional regulator with XRE-family HTH domain
LIEKACEVDDSCISVAGLASKVGHLSTRVIDIESARVGIAAIAKLIQLARREERLTPEQYAKRIGVGVEELKVAEAGTQVPEPRLLFAVSEALTISYQKLMSLAGHRNERNQILEQQALRFAASSTSMDTLTSVESRALHDLLQVLHD